MSSVYYENTSYYGDSKKEAKLDGGSLNEVLTPEYLEVIRDESPERANDSEIELPIVLSDGKKASLRKAQVVSKARSEDEGGEPSTTTSGSTDHTLKGLVYGITQNPSWHMSIALAFQHFFVMFGTVVATVLCVAPWLCLQNQHNILAKIISSTFFCSGITTLLQSLIGVRLPTVYGASFTYTLPVMSIWQASSKIMHSTPNSTTTVTTLTLAEEAADHGCSIKGWEERLSEVQGAVIMGSLIEMGIGLLGVTGFALQWLGPLTVSVTMTLTGLELFTVASNRASQNWWFALATVVLMAMFSQYSVNLAIPNFRFKRREGCVKEKVPIFLTLSILLAVAIIWIIYAICERFSNLEDTNIDCKDLNDFCGNFTHVTWFHWPYPSQFVKPKVNSALAVAAIFAGVMASVIESIGDYYTLARVTSAPPLPIHAINRGISIQGVGTLLFGLFGTPMGAVSYTENVGVIGTTKVASRRVVQLTAGIMLIFGIFPRFSAMFVTIPDPIKGGVFIVLFGMVTGLGISNLQFVDLNSSRNLFIIGFSLFFGISLPNFVVDQPDRVSVEVPWLDAIIQILLRNSMFVGGLSSLILDNTIPGTAKERGMIAFKKRKGKDSQKAVYNFPIGQNLFEKYKWAQFIPFLPTFDESLMKIKPKRKGRKSSTPRD